MPLRSMKRAATFISQATRIILEDDVWYEVLPDAKPVWADLQPRLSEGIDAMSDAEFPDVVLVRGHLPPGLQ